jgi:UDP-glucose 4-epimerase
LAAAYAAFADRVAAGAGFLRTNPTGYVETQGAFAQRFAGEIGQRLPIDCRVILTHQTEFPEPAVRINTDPTQIPGWSETAAWDAIAEYYGA